MMRRITVMLMALVFAVAASTNVLSLSETQISAIYQEPKIEIVIPSTGELLLNPRRLPVQMEGKVQFSNMPIINVPWAIENRSNVGIKVNAVVSGRVEGRSTMELSERSVANYTGEDKLIFLYLDSQVTDPGVDLQTGLDWFSTGYDPKEDIVVTEYEEERENLMTLAPANLDGSPAKGGIGAFHLSGDVTPDPWDPWVPRIDKVTVKIVFTFRPTDFSGT